MIFKMFWDERRTGLAQRHWVVVTFLACVVIVAPFAVLVMVAGRGSIAARAIVVAAIFAASYAGGIWRMRRERANWPSAR
jgi:hypothetical protein